MTDHDDRVSRRYRELGREQPPASLDDAILASARRAVRPARSRWVGGFSIAAVLVLAFGVTLRMQHEKPGIETSLPQAEAPARADAPPAAAPEAQPSPVEKPRIEAPTPSTMKRTRPVPPPAKPMPQEAPARSEDRAADIAPAPAARANAGAAPAPAMAPSQKSASRVQSVPAKDERIVELERIATLREQGKDADADAALARFRERHPEYAIPDALWARVKPR